MWSSAVIGYPAQGLLRCFSAYRTMVVMSGCLSFCSLPVNAKQAAYYTRTSLISKMFLPPELFTRCGGFFWFHLLHLHCEEMAS